MVVIDERSWRENLQMASKASAGPVVPHNLLLHITWPVAVSTRNTEVRLLRQMIPSWFAGQGQIPQF